MSFESDCLYSENFRPTKPPPVPGRSTEFQTLGPARSTPRNSGPTSGLCWYCMRTGCPRTVPLMRRLAARHLHRIRPHLGGDLSALFCTPRARSPSKARRSSTSAWFPSCASTRETNPSGRCWSYLSTPNRKKGPRPVLLRLSLLPYDFGCTTVGS